MRVTLDALQVPEQCLCQSRTATKYALHTRPLAIGMYVMSRAQTWLARSMLRPRSA